MQIIQFGDDGQLATRELAARWQRLVERRPERAERPLQGQIRTLEALDRQYGGLAPLTLEDAPDLVAGALTELALLEQGARRGPQAADLEDVAHLTLGVALWAMRHQVPITVVEPVANALAIRSNLAGSKAELAAVFGLMQGLVEYAGPPLAPDLERSNPERPWRILHVNLAITAIRTEDPVLMDYAFDALDRALPDERAGFYAEALALAMSPRIPAAVRGRIEERHLKYN